MDSRKIIYFDGVCNLCNWVVRFLLKRDKKGIFFFASLQSDFARQSLKKVHGHSMILDSVAYQEKDHIFLKSDAVLKIFNDLGGVWSMCYVFRVIPKSWRDRVYDTVAKNRYKWFGKQNTCLVPSREINTRFLG